MLDKDETHVLLLSKFSKWPIAHRPWLTCGPLTAHSWPTHSPLMAHSWPTHGPLIETLDKLEIHHLSTICPSNSNIKTLYSINSLDKCRTNIRHMCHFCPK